MTSRVITPRFSKACGVERGRDECERPGDWTPGKHERRGTMVLDALRPKRSKNSYMFSRSEALKVVKRGSGERRQPSNEGGILQTPPLPLRSLRCSFSVYSTKP